MNKQEFWEIYTRLMECKKYIEANLFRQWWNRLCLSRAGYSPAVKYRYEPDPLKDVAMGSDKITVKANGEIFVRGILY